MHETELESGRRVRLIHDIDAHWLDEPIKAGVCGTIQHVDLAGEMIARFIPDCPIEILAEWGGGLAIWHDDIDGDVHASDFAPTDS